MYSRPWVPRPMKLSRRMLTKEPSWQYSRVQMLQPGPSVTLADAGGRQPIGGGVSGSCGRFSKPHASEAHRHDSPLCCDRAPSSGVRFRESRSQSSAAPCVDGQEERGGTDHRRWFITATPAAKSAPSAAPPNDQDRPATSM